MRRTLARNCAVILWLALLGVPIGGIKTHAADFEAYGDAIATIVDSDGVLVRQAKVYGETPEGATNPSDISLEDYKIISPSPTSGSTFASQGYVFPYSSNQQVPVSANASATSSSENGVLTGEAYGTAFQDYTQVLPYQPTSNIIGSTFIAYGEASYDDAITLISSSKARGTPVIVTFDFSLEGSTNLSNQVFSFGLGYSVFDGVTTRGNGLDGNGPTYNNSSSLQINSYVGATLGFSAILQTRVEPILDETAAYTSADSFFDETAHTSANSVTSISISDSSVQYTSESGVKYPTSLPTGTAPQAPPAVLAQLGNWSNLLSSTTIGLGIALGGCFTPTPAAAVCWTIAGLSLAAQVLADFHDPPDYNFTAIAAPNPPPVPTLSSSPPYLTATTTPIVNDLLQNCAQLIGLQNALQTTYNRATGSYVSNAPNYVQQQLNAANGLFSSEQQVISNIAKDLNSLSAWFPNMMITAADVETFQKQLVSQGFSASEISMLEQLGLDPNDITGLVDMLDAVDPFAVAGTYPANFSTLASSLTAQ